MAVIPIVLFHDRALLQDKDWAYGTECTIAYVDEEDLITENDELKMQKDYQIKVLSIGHQKILLIKRKITIMNYRKILIKYQSQLKVCNEI